MNKTSLKPLSIAFALGGLWDGIAGFLYIFVIGTGRTIDNPAIHPYYAIFLGSFFLCFSYLQILSSFNIRRYAFNIGCLLFGRLFYIVILFFFMNFEEGFPSDFWFTGCIDGILFLITLVFSYRGGLKLTDLFLPKVGEP
jgi:hypothetical protein